MDFDAVVLAGGRGRRLGGVDKAAIVVGGRTLLERALDAAAGARRIVVVGPRRPVTREVTWTREDPAGGGPVAALAAGLQHSTAEVVVVLAVDHPFVDQAAVARLVEALGDHDGAVIADSQGRPALAGAYRVGLLRRRLEVLGDVSGVSMKRLFSGTSLARVTDSQAAIDADTTHGVEVAGELARELQEEK
jgi:molybdopterin-guanine dinucleotide biosynthesis protein A